MPLARLLLGRWERFWFAEVRSDVFALVRIAVGAAGLVSLIGFLPVPMFWSPDGIAPLPGDAFRLKSYLLESGLGVQVGWAIFVTLFASFVSMTLGLFTGWTVAICFLGSVFQTHWNGLPLTSGHTVLVAVLFCLVWADCGDRLSLDEWRRRRQSGVANPEPRRQPLWPLRLIQVQVAMVYASSGLFKLLGEAWRDGSAVHYTTTQNVYGRIFHVYPLPPGLDWMLTLLTYGTLFWELAFPFLMFHRVTRVAALAAGVAIHLGIWATMEVGPFTWMMLATYVAFLNPHRAARIVARWEARRSLEGQALKTA